MVTIPITIGPHAKSLNRRVQVRIRFEELTYAAFGTESGGILINLSEGGLHFQGFRAVTNGQVIRVTFKLPAIDIPIEASGRVVWVNESGKGGGLQFDGLSDAVRLVIRQWISSEADSAVTPAAPAASNPETVESSWAVTANAVPSVLSGDDKAQTTSAQTEHEGRASAWQISAPSPLTEAASVEHSDATSPQFLPEISELETQPAPRRPYAVFAAGTLAGCVVVLAGIICIRLFDTAGRPTTFEEAQASSGPRVTVPELQNPSRTGSANAPKVSSAPLVQSPRPAARAFGERTSTATANEKPKSFPTTAGQPQDSAEKLPTDSRNLTLQAPQLPPQPPKTELRESSMGEGAALGSITTDTPRPTIPSATEAPKSPQIPPTSSSRATGFLEAVPVQYPSPTYPAWALEKNIGGVVKIAATIGTDGVPRGLKVISGDPQLGRAAAEAISHWRYVPAVSAGIPVESSIVIAINFRTKQ